MICSGITNYTGNFQPEQLFFSEARSLVKYLGNSVNYLKNKYKNRLTSSFKIGSSVKKQQNKQNQPTKKSPTSYILSSQYSYLLKISSVLRQMQKTWIHPAFRMQRMHDFWDSQQPHSLVSTTYCSRTEQLLFGAVGMCIICWLGDLQVSVPLGNSWDCNCKLVTQRCFQLILISEIKVISEDINVIYRNNVKQIQANVNELFELNVIEGLIKC